MNLHDYTGVIHLHSSYSFDGHAHIRSILDDAQSVGVDFLMLTDHDHLRARDDGWEGWQGSTLLIVGQEVSPRFNHYLAFGITGPVSCPGDSERCSPQEYIDEVNRQGGFGIIAHPDHEGTQTFHVKHYNWNDWNVEGYMGMSVWDFMTDWQNSLQGYLSGLWGFLFPAYCLKGPRQITLERWDALNQIRKIVGIGELDNHASIKKLFGITFVAFPFKKAFRFVHTHVLTEEPFSGDSASDIERVFRSLRSGRCYFALEYFRPARGFQFLINQNGQPYYMGDTMKLSGRATLMVTVPETSRIRIIRNGCEWSCTTANHLSLPVTESGVYRVEIFLKSGWKFRPWIFSNPIFVG